MSQFFYLGYFLVWNVLCKHCKFCVSIYAFMQFFVARAPKYKSVKESLPFHYCVELNAYFNSGFGFLYHQINLIYLQFHLLLNKEMQKYKKKIIDIQTDKVWSSKNSWDGCVYYFQNHDCWIFGSLSYINMGYKIFVMANLGSILPNWTVFFLVSLNHVKSLKKKKGYIRCLIMQHTTSMKKTPIKLVFLRITWGTP